MIIISPRKIIKAHQLKSACFMFFFFNSEPTPKMRKPVKKHNIEKPPSKSSQQFNFIDRVINKAASIPVPKKIFKNIFSVLK